MRAGQLRHVVTIQQKSVSQDAYGEETITWSDVATVRAGIFPKRGREYIESKQEQADITHRILLRYRSGITPSMRIVYGSRVFEIVAPPINPAERDIQLEVMCREAIDA